jgi:hypothetical protein
MRSAAILLSLSLLSTGCGGRPVGLVSGKVTLDGQPLANATVNFQPSGDTLNPGVGSYGRTDAKGEYSLNLIDGTGPGAMIGTHRVMIRAIGEVKAAPNKDPEKASPDRVPPQYNLKTTLTFEVKAGNNVADWGLHTKAKP